MQQGASGTFMTPPGSPRAFLESSPSSCFFKISTPPVSPPGSPIVETQAAEEEEPVPPTS